MKTNLEIPVLLALALAAVTYTGCVAPEPGNDPLVIRAEQMTKSSFELFNEFLNWERDNRAVVPPGVQDFANRLRDQGPSALRAARAATRAYKADRSDDGRNVLAAAIAALEALKKETQRWFLTPPLPPGTPQAQALSVGAPVLMAAVPPAVVLAAIDGLLKLLTLIQGWVTEAKRRKEWTPEEEAQIDAKMEEAFRAAHWQKGI